MRLLSQAVIIALRSCHGCSDDTAVFMRGHAQHFITACVAAALQRKVKQSASHLATAAMVSMQMSALQWACFIM